MRVLGIDPGLRTTGFGVVERDGPRLAYIASGTIRTATAARGDLPAHTDLELMSRVLPALALHQVFLLHEPLTTERIAYLLDTVVLPACRTAAVA